jgi:hypothetical protein
VQVHSEIAIFAWCNTIFGKLGSIGHFARHAIAHDGAKKGGILRKFTVNSVFLQQGFAA